MSLILEILNKILDFFCKKLLEKLLAEAFYKNDKFSAQRAFWTIGAIIIGFALYFLPDALYFLYRYFPTLGENFPNLSKLKLTKYLSVSLYWSALVSFAYWKKIKRSSQGEEFKENERKVLMFVRDIRLVNGYRCTNKEERLEAENKIASLIGESVRTDAMVIHGYHNFTKSDSPIKKALENKKRNLKLRVLLLDPFSSYAQNRASQLDQETDNELSPLRYIRDHLSVVEALNHMKTGGGMVDYRIYCSNPFLRFYLFDEDFVFQTYQNNRHGHATPMYHFATGERSFFQAGKEMFSYYWNKGFLHEKGNLHKMGMPLIIYLANMYGLLVPGNPNYKKQSELIEMILNYVNERKNKAELAHNSGKLSEAG